MRFHFFDKTTGILHPISVHTNIEDSERASQFARANAPPDHSEIAGEYDHLCQRVDVTTESIVDYQPPAPSPDHEWNEVSKRWRLSGAAETKQSRIRELEASLPRALLEHALGYEGAKQKLMDIDGELVALQATVTK